MALSGSSSSSSSSSSISSTSISSSQLIDNNFISSTFYQGITKESLLSHEESAEGSIKEEERALPRLFVENRIYSAFEKVSANFEGRGKLLIPELIKPIFDYIKCLPYDEKEQDNGHTVDGLFTEIKTIKDQLSKGRFKHPYVPVLDQIKNDITQYLTATRRLKSTPAQNSTTEGEPPLVAYFAADTSDPSALLLQGELKENERFLPTMFVQYRILARFKETSAAYGMTHELLAKEDIAPLLMYMNNLPHQDKSVDGAHTVDGLFAKIDELEKTLKRRSSDHPYLSTLLEVRHELRAYFQASDPSLEDSINKTQKQRNAIIRNARKEQVEDCFCICVCLIWTPFEKLLTCCNLTSMCPEIPLPQERSYGTLHCNLFSPCNSISSFYDDITKQSQRIEQAQIIDAPVRQQMS